MRWMVLLPGFLGLAAVLQGGLNRQIMGSWGLAQAALLNTLVLLAAVGVLLLVARLWPGALPCYPRRPRPGAGGGPCPRVRAPAQRPAAGHRREDR